MTTDRRDIIQKFLDSIGLGSVQQWPALKGNNVVTLQIRTSVILTAQVGDVVKIKGGGYVRKIRDETWVQWQWFPDEETAEAAQPPSGPELCPPVPAEPSDAAGPDRQIPA